MQFRQGDVFLERVESLPDGAKPFKGPLILAEGEATGHAHRVRGGRARFFEAAGERFLRVTRAAVLKHEEHDEIGLAPGVYHVHRQREYSPQEIRNVAD